MVDRSAIRPGGGWTHIAGAVYDHVSGVRLHLLGLARLPNGDNVSANEWPEASVVDYFVQCNGGSKKRGLMAWARHKADERIPVAAESVCCRLTH